MDFPGVSNSQLSREYCSQASVSQTRAFEALDPSPIFMPMSMGLATPWHWLTFLSSRTLRLLPDLETGSEVGCRRLKWFKLLLS